MRGLIGLCVGLALVLATAGVANAKGAEACIACVCVKEMVATTFSCCVPVSGSIDDTQEGSFPPDVSACWEEGQFDADECKLLCEQFNELPSPPPGCRPGPCGDDEEERKVEVISTRARGVGKTVSPCEASCPDMEAGQCNDGVNNDAWLDDLTDTEDPDCKAATPAASPYAIAVLLITLACFGAYRLRGSRAGRPS